MTHHLPYQTPEPFFALCFHPLSLDIIHTPSGSSIRHLSFLRLGRLSPITTFTFLIPLQEALLRYLVPRLYHGPFRNIYVDGGCGGNWDPGSIGAAATLLTRRWDNEKSIEPIYQGATGIDLCPPTKEQSSLYSSTRPSCSINSLHDTIAYVYFQPTS